MIRPLVSIAFVALLGGTALAQVPVAPAAEAAEVEADDANPTDGSRAGYDADALSDEGFRPAYGTGDEDTIPGGRLMLAAYIVFFALLGWYSVRLSRRHSAVQQELSALRKSMEDIDDRLDDLEKGTAG